jgi:hypothetical protein
MPVAANLLYDLSFLARPVQAETFLAFVVDGYNPDMIFVQSLLNIPKLNNVILSI